MDLSEIPFDVPVIVHSIRKNKNLQNPLGSKKAHCLTDNRDVYEQLMLRHVRDDKVTIQSVRNGRFLHVRTSGECIFDAKEPGDWELFTMETNSTAPYTSYHATRGTSFSATTITWSSVPTKTVWIGRRGGFWNPVPLLSRIKRRVLRTNVTQGKERREFILELARCGKTPEEIEKIVMKMFDAPAEAHSARAAVAVPVDKE